MKIGSWIHQEICKLEKLDDENEKRKRHDLLDEIIDGVNEYRSHIYEYKKKQVKLDMESREAIYTESKMTKEQLMKSWEQTFASDIREEVKKKVFFDQFLWHTFSYGVLDAKQKSKARQAFNRKKKSSVFVFYQHQEEAYFIEHAEKLKSSDFNLEDDIYILDSNMKWTYVHTHESQCGPYFYSEK